MLLFFTVSPVRLSAIVQTVQPSTPASMLKGLSVPIVILLLIVPLLAFTSWYTHLTLAHGAAIDQLFRDIQYHRTRLGILQINEETGVRGYVITGDRNFLRPFETGNAGWRPTVQTLAGELRSVNLPLTDLDAMQRLHQRWLVTVAQPLIENRRRPNALALQYRGKGLIDGFRVDQNHARAATESAAVSAEANLQRTIDATLGFGAGATVAVLLIGMISVYYQVRSTQRLTRMNFLYENEKRIADALQEAFLLKRLPLLPGIVLNATYVPSSHQARVGGDWYDAFELPDGRMLFSIGDVAGNGIEAAVVMSRARQAILAAALQESDPAMVLQRANATILLQEDVMVTAICGFIDPDNLETIYATAGHPPPILAHAAEPPTFLPHDGLALGIDPGAKYRTFVTRAVKGDVLVLYTDGLIEHQRDIESGMAKLLELAAVAQAAPDPAVALYDAVFDAGLPSDDVAILTVSFTPQPIAIDPTPTLPLEASQP